MQQFVSAAFIAAQKPLSQSHAFIVSPVTQQSGEFKICVFQISQAGA